MLTLETLLIPVLDEDFYRSSMDFGEAHRQIYLAVTLCWVSQTHEEALHILVGPKVLDKIHFCNPLVASPSLTPVINQQ